MKTILWSAYKLRGTNIIIDRDYPNDIVEARKKVYGESVKSDQISGEIIH